MTLTKLGVDMSAEADGVSFAPRARAAEQNFPGQKHGKVIFVVQRSEAGFLSSVISFINSYHSGCSTTYSWNNFFSPSFNTNIGVGQGSALSSILSAIYFTPIIKTFKKRIKNLKENIPTDILSFVDNSLLISQKKSYSLSSSFLLCSYNIMSKILLDVSLVIEHSKTELFYFMRAQYSPNPSIDLSSVIFPKPIW